MTDTTAGGGEPEILEETGTKEAVSGPGAGAEPEPEAEVDADAEPEDAEPEAGPKVEVEPWVPPARRRAAPDTLPGRFAASQMTRLFGGSHPLARLLRQTAWYRQFVQGPAAEVMGRRLAAVFGGTDLVRRFVAATGGTELARQLTAASGAAEMHRLLFARFGEAWRSELWKDLVPPSQYLRYLTEIGERFKVAVFIFVPANLRPLSAADWRRILEIGREEGIALAWVVRTELVQALLDAPDAAAREQLLLQEEAALLDDCTAALAAVTEDADMMEQAGFVQEAVDVCRSGGYAAAQALATNVVETIAKHHLDRVVTGGSGGVSSRLRARFGVPVDDSIALDELRVWLVGTALFAAYRVNYDYATRDRTYNRHGTAHCVNRSVYRPENALRALLLATSLLRLMDEELAAAEQVA